ncbi:phage holin [Caloramator sp. CAR-1]|uniref:phage holin n=1 Tax=Caloramator sp. CAR-1 TaxID=3062777 RepID=UPI0026E29637|nr:phage holin [Caloramator sp. CAR-1]MDO6355261.1 phage holin [Caloramator sp. CAR-1]
MNWKARLRNKAFWVSLAAFVAMMAKQFGWFEVPPNYEEIVNSALGLLVMLGIIIDPTTPGIKDVE